MSFFKAGHKLFERINTTHLSSNEGLNGKAEVLDRQEILKAKQMGFSLFDLKEGMNANEFATAYEAAIENTPDNGVNIEKQTKELHIKYLQLKYATNEKPKENETIEQFEQRLQSGTNKSSTTNLEPKTALERLFDEKSLETLNSNPKPAKVEQPEKYFVHFFEDLARDLTYQEILDKQVEEILKGEKSISFDELENNSTISEILQKLDEEDRKQIKFISKLENNSKTITEKELRLILTVLDVIPEVTNRQNGSRLLGYIFDGQSTKGSLAKIPEETLRETFELLQTKEARVSYLEKNKEIYSKYDDANGVITPENFNNLINDLVASTGIFEEFPKMKGVILKDATGLGFMGKNWAESFEELKGSILGSININRIATGYGAEKESGKDVDVFNYGGKKIDKMIDQVRANLNLQ